LAELAAKHGVHHTMIASWKRRAVDGMAKMGLTPIYQRPRTSDPHPQRRVYPKPLDPDATSSRIRIAQRFEVWS
jgi:hypothetical protein